MSKKKFSKLKSGLVASIAATALALGLTYSKPAEAETPKLYKAVPSLETVVNSPSHDIYKLDHIYPYEEETIINTPYKPKDRLVVLGFDMAWGAFYSGISRGIHFKKENKNFWKGFGQGFYYGLFGGLVRFFGREVASYQEIPLMGKLIHDLGNSVIDNSALGLRPFQRYQTDFGPLLITLGEDNQGKFYANYSIRLLPLAGIITNLAMKNLIDPKASFYNMELVFKGDPQPKDNGHKLLGLAIGNVSFYSTNKTVLSHENQHVLSYESFRIANEWIPKLKLGKGWDISFGQDVFALSFMAPQAICNWSKGYEACSRFNIHLPTEFLAYSMQK